MSTTGRATVLGPPDFQGPPGRTGHHATCGALPAAGPYLRLSRFQGGQAIRTDGRSARARAQGFAATAAPSYSSGLALAPTAGYRSRASAPSIFGLVDSADERFARQYRCGPPPEFPLASPRSGIVHHLSGPDRYAHTQTLLRRSRSVGVAPSGGSRQSASLRLTVYSPVDSHTCQTPWSVFQDGSNGEPAGQHREHADAEARLGGACCPPQSGRRHSTGISTARALAAASIRAGPRPESIGRPAHRRSTSDRDASPTPIRFPPDNFKHSLTLFSKFFSSFPRGTCSLSVSRLYLALDGIYRPIGAAFPNNPTRRQRLVVRQGPSTTGLSPSLAPLSRGLGLGPPLRRFSRLQFERRSRTIFKLGFSRFARRY
ncbi:Uncharacterized protein Adt_48587 [Abeliophyllum distichum]|uniref:Protein TAR1 n=1 Tax=Abeliophyllum distichum TaxID=126358 RepID=A0ABD1NS39_9LAMI